MKALLTVLQKTIINQFYRQNAGLFFVVLMLAGSFLRADDHIALAEATVHSQFMLGLYQAVWALYTLFATRFAVDVIRQTEVLYLFRLVPAPRRWLGLITVQFALLNPILVYAAFVGWISWQQGTVSSSWQLVVGAICMLILPIFWLDYALRTPNKQSLTASIGARWSARFTTPYSLFFIRYLIRNQPVLLFITKGGTGLLLFGVLRLYPTDDYDSRLLALGALLMAVGHSTMMYHLYQFEHERLAVLRNLPIPHGKRLLNYAGIVALLTLPEAVILFRYQPTGVSFSMLVSVWALGHSIMLLLFTSLLPRHRSLDQLMPTVFSILLVFFFAIMYQIPAWGLSAFNWLIASVLFVRFYMKSVWITESAQ